MQFPRQLTIKLPALQREALQAIHNHEPQNDPARILERLLARGIYSRLATMEDGPEGEETAEQTIDVGRIPLALHLDREVRQRIAILLRDTPKANLASVILGIFELGLEAFSENLSIVESSSTDEDGSK